MDTCDTGTADPASAAKPGASGLSEALIMGRLYITWNVEKVNLRHYENPPGRKDHQQK